MWSEEKLLRVLLQLRRARNGRSAVESRRIRQDRKRELARSGRDDPPDHTVNFLDYDFYISQGILKFTEKTRTEKCCRLV